MVFWCFKHKESERTSSSVFFVIGKTFCLHGGQEHRELKLSQLERLHDPDRYVYYEYASKNKQGGTRQLRLDHKVVSAGISGRKTNHSLRVLGATTKLGLTKNLLSTRAKENHQESQGMRYSGVMKQLGPEVCSHILFLHAVLGCDTTSRLYSIGKGNSLKSSSQINTFVNKPEHLMYSQLPPKMSLLQGNECWSSSAFGAYVRIAAPMERTPVATGLIESAT